ncbi:hypothetical protein [Micromonospora yangpuensis]|uniref:Uncharacterized protein n=1 Tax=Micromonospora yangpuensis TaxID=683228 RepID=A0A1C6UTP2_9ACTN|nr:hypothetical protein [Micromonospora yangpuensis]GGM24665.1 hypothetical protein GCM10012279_48860 [Micromonospora yangpuensis]SCL57405.1 hypothetical protein GA0070617_3514 [Micromonospora yangpuensis]
MWRNPRVVVAVVITGLLTAATVLTGLITNEASAQQRWPGLLELVRTHPWHTLGVLAVLLVALTVVLAALPEGDRSRGEGTPGQDGAARPAAAVPPAASSDPVAPARTSSGRVSLLDERPDRLDRLSAGLVGRLGRRRTAYPLDLSLAELHRMGLFVPGRLAAYHDRAAGPGEQSVVALVARLRRGESVLLLGEPGSGKSLTLYGVALALLSAGRLPLPLRALDAVALLDTLRGAGLDLAGLPGAVVLVDGLDEASELFGGGPLATALLNLMRHAPVLVTSRTREYEEWIAFETTEISFDEVFVLRGWSVETEFADYLLRLQRHGLITDPDLYRTVVTSQRLTGLVTRPLYARMLTFIGQDAATRITSTSGLYGEYLTRLGHATDFAVRSGHPDWTGDSLALWQTAAWFVHSRGLSADAIPIADLHVTLTRGRGRSPTVRALDQVIDRRTLHGIDIGEFLHYSFYEYLLARHIRDRLLSDLTAGQATALLRRDLTREVRHHLAGQLQELSDERLGDWLSASYRQIRDEPGIDQADRLTVCNLLVYLISRTSPQAQRQLDALLHRERDEFLLSAILWALCHHRSDQALARFFALLQYDAVFRACNRGYVLYYYGDVRTGRPPFLDEPPHQAHERTSTRVLAMFESPTFRIIPAQRRYVDLYTFIDIYLVRHETVDGRALSTLRAAVADLSGQGLASPLVEQLSEMLQAISGQPIPDANPPSFSG